jgi:hypothetical protein
MDVCLSLLLQYYFFFFFFLDKEKKILNKLTNLLSKKKDLFTFFFFFASQNKELFSGKFKKKNLLAFINFLDVFNSHEESQIKRNTTLVAPLVHRITTTTSQHFFFISIQNPSLFFSPKICI